MTAALSLQQEAKQAWGKAHQADRAHFSYVEEALFIAGYVAAAKSRDQRIMDLEAELAKREYPTARTSGG